MNTQTVTVQTARLLAAAGFPQPAPAPGQWWSNGENFIFVWRKWKDGLDGCFTITEVFYNQPLVRDRFPVSDFTSLVYLPTVGDILAQPIAEGYGVSRQYDTTESGFSWVCAPMEWSMPDMVSAMHETSAAEAAALAYLDLHEKNT